MVSLVLFMLASICSAIMDTCQFHYEKSIFVKFNNPMYWNGLVSWESKYIGGKYQNGMRKCLFGLFDYPAFLTDAFHLFKTTMIFLVVVAIVLYKPTLSYFDLDFCKPLLILFDFVLFGTIWNLFFDIFFNRILVTKKK